MLAEKSVLYKSLYIQVYVAGLGEDQGPNKGQRVEVLIIVKLKMCKRNHLARRHACFQDTGFSPLTALNEVGGYNPG